jgi:hypothetical protein
MLRVPKVILLIESLRASGCALLRGIPVVPHRIRAATSQVLTRRSTNLVATDEPDPAKGLLRFVRDHALAGVSADEVALLAGLYYRALEKRFRKVALFPCSSKAGS